MPELASKRTRAIVKIGYFEDPEVYHFRCDDPDLDWDLGDLEAYCEDDVRLVLRDLVICLQNLGRTVEVEHYVIPELSDRDAPDPDGKYHLTPLRHQQHFF